MPYDKNGKYYRQPVYNKNFILRKDNEEKLNNKEKADKKFKKLKTAKTKSLKNFLTYFALCTLCIFGGLIFLEALSYAKRGKLRNYLWAVGNLNYVIWTCSNQDCVDFIFETGSASKDIPIDYFNKCNKRISQTSYSECITSYKKQAATYQYLEDFEERRSRIRERDARARKIKNENLKTNDKLLESLKEIIDNKEKDRKNPIVNEININNRVNTTISPQQQPIRVRSWPSHLTDFGF